MLALILALLPGKAALIRYALIGVGAVTIVGGALAWAHHAGYSSARSECKEAALRAELKEAKDDLRAAKAVAAQAERLRAETEQSYESAKEETARYAEALKTRPGGGCALTDDDRPRRMQRPTR